MPTRQLPATALASPATARPSWRARAGRRWRALGTGLCFVVYGSLGWLAGVTVLPVLLLWPGSQAARQRRIRRFVAWTFRGLMAAIAGLRVGYLRVEGREWLACADGKLLVANHPMYLDVVALVGLLPQADCVVKQAMWANPWYRRFVRVIGYIGNASQSGLVQDCVAHVQRGRPLILFPEGTRSPPGQPLAFKRGAAQVAVRSGCDVLPVVIRCEPRALGKQQAWHEVAARPWTLHVRICPPRTLAELGLGPDMPYGVAARHVNHALEQFFVRELARDGQAGDAAADADTAAVARSANARA